MKASIKNRFNYIKENLDYAHDQLTDRGYAELHEATDKSTTEKLMIVDSLNKHFWLIDKALKNFSESFIKREFKQHLHLLNSVECTA